MSEGNNSNGGEGQGRKGSRLEIRTFRGDRLTSVGQKILDLSHGRRPSLRILDEVLPKSFNGENVAITQSYARPSPTEYIAFPARTKGVFYFHHIRGDNTQSQIRFRLCNTLDEFHHGEDLRNLDGGLWHITLKAIARAPDRKYRPVLALLQEEFPIEPSNVDASHVRHRVVSTLDPQKLPSSGQTVIDISGFTNASVHIGGRESGSALKLFYKRVRNRKALASVKYPPDTIGLYYYKQSLTAPTQLGELRFRLS